jgi:ketosteroid isomerase-like protein
MGEASEVVRTLYEALHRGDNEAMLALYHPDVVWDMRRSGIPDAGLYEGHEGMKEFWRMWRGTWERYAFDVEEMIEDDERVLALVHFHVRSRGLGVESHHKGAELFRVRGGRVIEFAGYLDRELARLDSGL